MDGFEITDWIYYLMIIIYVITIMGTVVVVISENRNPLKSIAWIVVLLFFPVGGLIFYIFLGRDFRKQRMISRKSLKKINRYSFTHQTHPSLLNLPVASSQEVELLYNVNHAKLYAGNEIEIFTQGKPFFESLFQELEKATKFIHLEFYIFQNDTLGNRMKDLLIRKVSEGVEVRVIYDDVGCWSVKNIFFQEMKAAGIQVSAFLEVRFPAFANKINYRNHRKIVVIDGVTGYIGGMNIADRYQDGLPWGIWRDTQIRIDGPAVQGLQTAFSVDWYFTDKQLLWDSRYFPEVQNCGSVSVQIATSGPIGEWKELMLGIFKAISIAKQYVYIQTPYFLPTDALMLAMQAAALSNVDVRLMIPIRSDTHLVQIGTYSYVRSMLKAGVKVYFYEPGFLHAKMIAIDDEFCTVGSTNMDFRSFEHNFEGNAFIYDRQVTRQMKNIFLRDQQNCKRMTLREWNSRPIRQKAFESVIRLFSPML
ncbi:MAG: cardiolipin synthase [Bacteroidales bacterium]